MSSEGNGPEFDLHALVRTITDGSGLLGPREIAAKVAENVPNKHLRAALAITLVDYVRQELIRARMVPTSPAASARNSARSSRSAAIREAWRKRLAAQYHVGGGAWQVLADCSYENVLFLAAERTDAARRTKAAAEMYARLAAAMKKRRVDRAGDLPESVLAQILTTEDPA